MDEKYIIEKMQENEDRSKSNTRRLDEHDKKLDELSNVYVALTKVDDKVTNVEKDVTEIKGDIKGIKEKPMKRYEQVVSVMITRYSDCYTGLFFRENRFISERCDKYGSYYNIGNFYSYIDIWLVC